MLVPAATAPVHETPNAVMRTLAAPSRGSAQLAVWELAMRAGQIGPLHRVSGEQVWVVQEGALEVELDGRRLDVSAGEVLVLPPDVERRIRAARDCRALVASPAAPTVTTADGGSRPLPWAC